MGVVHIDYVYKMILKYASYFFYNLQNKIPRACLRNIYFALLSVSKLGLI